MDVYVLFLSILVQFAAAGLAINFLRRTGYRLAWGTIAIALILMGLRRSVTFWQVVVEQNAQLLDPAAEYIALVISLLMLAGVVLIGRMFNEEKRRAENLDATRQLLQQTIDAAPMVITIKNAEQRHVFVNQFGAARFGFEPKEFVGRTLAEILPEREYAEFVRETAANDALLIAEGETIPFFEETTVIDGKPRFMLVSKTPLFDHAGNVNFLLTIALDITSRKETEETLKVSEEQRRLAEARLKEAIGAMTDGFAFYDSEGKLEFFNESFRLIHQYDKGDVEPGVTTYDDLGELDKQRAKGMREPLSFEERFKYLCDHGPKGVISSIGDRVYERRQTVTPEGGIISMVSDITELKEIEEALVVTKTEAEKANLAKSHFLASMSHELRTPLNAILGFSQLLELDAQKILTLKQKEYLDDVMRGGSHLLDLVNELLDLAKIESNEVRLDIRPVDVAAVVEDCLRLSEPMRMKREVNVLNNLVERPPAHLMVDEVRLKQVMLNLISNAIRFNKDGGTVTIDGAVSNGGLFHLSVRDTGRGIPDESHGEIFHMFHQIGGSPELATEGTGVGLYVSKLLIERMNGIIGFESEYGVGSTFWIELPLVDAAQRSG